MAPSTDRRPRRILRILGIASLVAAASLAGPAIAAVALVGQAASRVVIDPDALGKAMQGAVLATGGWNDSCRRLP